MQIAAQVAKIRALAVLARILTIKKRLNSGEYSYHQDFGPRAAKRLDRRIMANWKDIGNYVENAVFAASFLVWLRIAFRRITWRPPIAPAEQSSVPWEYDLEYAVFRDTLFPLAEQRPVSWDAPAVGRNISGGLFSAVVPRPHWWARSTLNRRDLFPGISPAHCRKS